MDRVEVSAGGGSAARMVSRRAGLARAAAAQKWGRGVRGRVVQAAAVRRADGAQMVVLEHRGTEDKVISGRHRRPTRPGLTANAGARHLHFRFS